MASLWAVYLSHMKFLTIANITLHGDTLHNVHMISAPGDVHMPSVPGVARGEIETQYGSDRCPSVATEITLARLK